jgi:hypothetical protein
MDRRQQCGIEAWWFNQFAARARPSPECEPKNSHVFATWFTGYFAKGARTPYRDVGEGQESDMMRTEK